MEPQKTIGGKEPQEIQMAAKKSTKASKTSKAPVKAKVATKASKPLVTPQNSTNPYRVGSSYFCVVESLRNLGLGKIHSAEKLIAEFVKVCPKDKLAAFKNREARNEETAKDWKNKIIVNATVVERKDYGASLRKLGFEVRHEKDQDGYRFGIFRMNGKK